MQKLDSAIITLNNLWVKSRKKKVKPENILLLLASCLQNSACKQNLAHDVTNCKQCGRCKVGDLLELAQNRNMRIFMATGGGIALKEAKKKETKAIVAVACEKELREGILATLPKAVMGVVNLRPCGPCKDCSVEQQEVEKALDVFLENRES